MVVFFSVISVIDTNYCVNIATLLINRGLLKCNTTQFVLLLTEIEEFLVGCSWCRIFR